MVFPEKQVPEVGVVHLKVDVVYLNFGTSNSSTECCKKAIEETVQLLMIPSLSSIMLEGVAQLIFCPHRHYACVVNSS